MSRSPVHRLTCASALSLALAMVAGRADASVIVNPAGGVVTDASLRLRIAESTAIEVYHGARDQFASPAGILVAHGAKVHGAGVLGAHSWQPVAQPEVSGDGTAASPYVSVTQ